MSSSSGRDAWSLDQLAKSQFFHAKVHEWGLLEVITKIDQVQGDTLPWDRVQLGILQRAWDMIIHRGIKPVVVFAHPHVLVDVPRSVSYYRMLSMVSQKSMAHVKLVKGDFADYEEGKKTLNSQQAADVARHLNGIISNLISMDTVADSREFDLWRGMAAGTQAQGSWQNVKGQKAEAAIKGILYLRLKEAGRIASEVVTNPPLTMEISLQDGRRVVFADDPDIAIYRDEQPLAVVEVKGGIDAAGVHERRGATLKSLIDAQQSNPVSARVLILQGVSLTAAAQGKLDSDQAIVNHWFTSEDILDDEAVREQLFGLLGI